MNIHEHQAKEILKKYGIPVLNGVVIFNTEDIDKKIKKLKSANLVIKAQIHAGGRGKAGGIKIVKDFEELKEESNKMLGKVLTTHQTGKLGSKVRRLYIEETCNIEKEFYLSCLVDRTSSKIAFISSSEGGVDIEEVAKKNPEKIITVKLDISGSISNKDLKKIIKPFGLPSNLEKNAFNVVQSIYKILIEKDANLIEINPLILTKDNNLICLDAKMSFDDNALYRHEDILSLKDLSEEDSTEKEASKQAKKKSI